MSDSVNRLPARYDVFKKMPDGERIWLFEADSVQDAKLKLAQMEQRDSAVYYVCDLSTRKVMAMAAAGSAELKATMEDPGFFTPPDGHRAPVRASSRGPKPPEQKSMKKGSRS